MIGRNTTPVSPEVSSTPEAMMEDEMSDWNYKTSSECNIQIPIPPNKEPYSIPDEETVGVNDEGAFWQYREGLSQQFLFNHMVRAIIVQPDAASGYVPGAVDIFCADNTQGFTTEALVEDVENTLKEVFNPEVSEPAVKITLTNKRLGNMWGLPVYIANFEGGMYGDEDYYFLATDSNIYMIKKVFMSKNQNIIDATEKVFENIKFK